MQKVTADFKAQKTYFQSSFEKPKDLHQGLQQGRKYVHKKILIRLKIEKFLM
jgi:hypothetical protein